MKVIRITFNEPARLCRFHGVLPSGHKEEIDVAPGEVWYAPTTEGNLLMAKKDILVENGGWQEFHDLGRIGRTTGEPARWTRIKAENRGVDFPRPQLPHYEARVIEFEPADSTHEDYMV